MRGIRVEKGGGADIGRDERKGNRRIRERGRVRLREGG